MVEALLEVLLDELPVLPVDELLDESEDDEELGVLDGVLLEVSEDGVELELELELEPPRLSVL